MPKNNEKTTLALISKDIDYIKRDVAEIKTKLEADYVTQEEFSPVKKIVYGLVSIILVAVAGALIGLVVLR
jgi:hypothetical protein